MNREEALREMINGAKVHHEYFTSEEYLIMDAWGKIKTEDGYDFADQFFGNEFFATGWSVVKNKVVILGNEMRLINMDPIGETREFGIEKQISQSQLQNWHQSRQLAQKSALRLSAHEGVYSRWNQSKQGGRPFGKRLQSRRIPRSR